MKPLHAKWIMNLCDEITSEKGKEIVLNGQKAVGILGAVEMGSAKLKCLDPLGGGSISFEDDIQFPKESNLDVNERYESDSDDEYILDDERNAIDAIAGQIKFDFCKLF